MPAGQPAKFATPESLDEKMQEYFDHCEEKGLLTTIPGLVVHCGYADRASFLDQEKRSPQFSRVIKRARQRLEENHIRAGRTMDIFVMKNHYSYVDKTEVKHDASDSLAERLQRAATREKT